MKHIQHSVNWTVVLVAVIGVIGPVLLAVTNHVLSRGSERTALAAYDATNKAGNTTNNPPTAPRMAGNTGRTPARRVNTPTLMAYGPRTDTGALRESAEVAATESRDSVTVQPSPWRKLLGAKTSRVAVRDLRARVGQ